jgi:hypothetical protein
MHHLTISVKKEKRKKRKEIEREREGEGEREDDRWFHLTPSLTFRLEQLIS